MQDLTPLQVTAIYHMQRIINEEKAKSYKNSPHGGRKRKTIEEYRRRKEGSDLYTEKVTPEQAANWKKIKERLQQNPVIAR